MSLAICAVVSLAALAATEAVPWGAHGREVGTKVEVPIRARVQVQGHLGEPAPTIVAGQPIILSYEVKNEGSRPVTLWHAGFWPNHRIVVRDAGGGEVPLLPAGRARSAAFAPRGARDKNVAWSLAAGGVDSTESGQELTAVYDLSRPGAYSVEVIYEEDVLLTSNRLAVVVTPGRPATGSGAPVDIDFTARILGLRKQRTPSPGALVVGADPRFLLSVHVLSVSRPDAPFPPGADQGFAIHSPAKLLLGEPVPVGQTRTFRLTGTPVGDRMSWFLAPGR